MVRIYQLLALISLLPALVGAQVVTNNTAAPVNRSWSTTVGQPWYLRVHAVQGSTPYVLSTHRIDWTVRHEETEALVLSTTGTIHVVDPGQVILRWTPPAAGVFRSVATIYSIAATATVAKLVDDTITVTSAPSAGAASVTINDPTMFVTGNGTSTPDSVSIQDQAGTVITGTLVGAHLYLHLPPGVQTVQGVAGAVTLGAGSGTSRVGEVYWDSTTLRAGTNQPYGEILTLDIPVVDNTAAVDIARGYSFRCAPTGSFKLAFSTPRSSTNTASWGVIDFIGIASTNWISFDYSTIESNSAAAVTLGTGAVWSLKYYAPAGQAVNKVGVYDLL